MYENLDLWCISSMVSANPLSFLFANFLVAFMIHIIKNSLSAMNVPMQTIFYIIVVSIVLLSRHMRDGLWHDLCQTSLSTVFIVYLIQKRRQCYSTKSCKSWQIKPYLPQCLQYIKHSHILFEWIFVFFPQTCFSDLYSLITLMKEMLSD